MFGITAELKACCEVLRTALMPSADIGDVRDVAGTLERLAVSLRRLDLARLIDVPDVLYDSALPVGSYLLRGRSARPLAEQRGRQ